MQTELFEKNAITLLYDDMQALLYGDILTANGFAVQHTESVIQLMQAISNNTDMVMINADNIEKNALIKISEIMKERNQKAPLIGLTIQDNVGMLQGLGVFSSVIKKPISIDSMVDTICSAFSDNSEYGLNDTCLQTY